MAYFAKIDENRVVVQVIFIDNANAPDEKTGSDYCNSIIPGTWIQTSYNSRIRKNYAGVGYVYSEELDAFIPPKPFPSWVLNEDTCLWSAPIPYPNDGSEYYWEESEIKWNAVEG